MTWVNYNHLYYFWAVVREGGLVGASRTLRVTQSTISDQVRSLERSLGEALFVRTGRRLVLTDVGQVAYRYAAEIFALGQEMRDSLAGRPTGRPTPVVVGISATIPDAVAWRFLAPALALREPVQLTCRRERLDVLMPELSAHTVDVVLSDRPAPEAAVRAHSHLLGHTGIAMAAAPSLAQRFRRNFPRSLEGAPVLLPAPQTALRRSLDRWFDANHVRPQIVCEFHDSGLMESFGAEGIGLFPVHVGQAGDVKRKSGARIVGELDGVREDYYAVTVRRRIRNPAVIAITAITR